MKRAVGQHAQQSRHDVLAQGGNQTAGTDLVDGVLFHFAL
jgi:hypothetical protein